MTNIGNWLQQKREADGMTLKAQSELVGIKNTVLCELSSGKRPVTEKTLDRIIEGYKMTDEEKRNFYSALVTENEKKRAKQAAALNCTQFFGHFMLSYLYIELQLEFDNKEHLNLFHN